jgi:hypothetical protein
MLKSNLELFNQLHPVKNNLDLSILKLKSNKKLWWICTKGHEWIASIVNRSSNGTGCPYCSNSKVCPENSLLIRYPDIAKEWCTDKNTLTATEILPGNNKKFWWQCSINPEHLWETSPNARCIKGSGCPHCRGNTIFGSNTIANKFPIIAKEWHPTKNEIFTPNNVCPNAKMKAWWLCPQKHEYQAICANRTRSNSGCPYCKGKKTCEDNNLLEGFPKIASEWHPTKNVKSPTEYTISSGKKVWWQCSKNPNHEWFTTIVNRTDKGTGCPVCSGRIILSEHENII